MKLSDDQIQQLFSFMEKKRVPYYDLQLELVDHMAERIEEAMSENPSLSFTQAIQKVYNDFGIFGFSTIVREKENQVYRRGQLLFWKEIRKLFGWPKILTVAATGFFLWQLSQWINMEILIPVFFSLWILLSVFLVIKQKRLSKTRKRSLLILTYNPDGGLIPFLVIQSLVLMPSYHWNPVAFCIIVLAGIMINFSSWQVYHNLLNEARCQYPDAFT